MAWTIAGSNASSYCQHLTLIEAVQGVATKTLAWPSDYGSSGQFLGRPLEVVAVRSQFWTSTTVARRAPKLIVRDGFNRSMFSIVGVDILGGAANDYRVVEFCSDMVPFGGTATDSAGAAAQKIHRIPIPRDLLVQPGWSLVVTQDGDNEVNTLTANVSPPTGGTFTLTISGQVTTALVYNASAATIQAALEALSTVGVGGVRCEATTTNLGTGNGQVTIRWMSFESADVAISIQNSVTGGGGGHALATTTAGANAIVAGDTNVAVVTAQVLA